MRPIVAWLKIGALLKIGSYTCIAVAQKLRRWQKDSMFLLILDIDYPVKNHWLPEKAIDL